MRIRKHTPRPVLADVVVLPPPTLGVCMLNCSPWDVLDFDMTSPCKKEEEKVLEAITAINTETNKYCNIKKEKGSWDCSRHAELELSSDLNGHKKRKAGTSETRVLDSYNYCDGFGPWGGKKRRTIKTEVKVKVEEEISEEISDLTSDGDGDMRAEEIKHCSKRGKGWHCTRPAMVPDHTFCDYHLSLLRTAKDNKMKKKNKTTRQGKRRGGRDLKVEGDENAKRVLMGRGDENADIDYDLAKLKEEIAYHMETHALKKVESHNKLKRLPRKKSMVVTGGVSKSDFYYY